MNKSLFNLFVEPQTQGMATNSDGAPLIFAERLPKSETVQSCISSSKMIDISKRCRGVYGGDGMQVGEKARREGKAEQARGAAGCEESLQSNESAPRKAQNDFGQCCTHKKRALS